MKEAGSLIKFTLEPQILWIAFALAIVIFATMSFIFIYHWRYYGIAGNHRIFAKNLYFIIGITLLVAMFISITLYIQ